MEKEQAAIVRALAGACGRVPVEVTDGADGPSIAGRPGYYTTPSGKTIVRYPSAYGHSVRYHPSTQVVRVGRAWLERNIRFMERRREDGVLAVYDVRRVVYDKARDISVWPSVINRHFLVIRGSGDNRRTWHASLFSCRTVEGAVLSAIEAWARQDALAAEATANRKNEMIEALEGMAPGAVPVFRWQSTLAGNCQLGTERFGRVHKLPDGVPASLVMRAADKSNALMRNVSAALRVAAIETLTVISI